MKSANSVKKTPDVTHANGTSRKILKSGKIDPPGFGGSLDLTRRIETKHKPAMMNPITRVAHAKPTCGINDCNISGNMMPPIEPPHVAIPVAAPRFT
jgi:hypothetical protein